MFTRWLLSAFLALLPHLVTAADAAFFPTGKRMVFVAPGEGQIACLDLDERKTNAPSTSLIDIAHAGGPKLIQGLVFSRKGNLLLAAPDAVWAYDPAAAKAVRVAALPEKFGASDLAYQESTGAILVWGTFIKEDRTVDRFAVFRIGKGESKAVPVYAEGIEAFEHAVFDAAGRLFFSAGPDLWGGDLTETEHQAAGDFDWQLRTFRLAALGTPVAGEGPNAGQRIDGLAVGGGKLLLTLGGEEGSRLVRLSVPTLPRYAEGQLNRLIDLQARWAFQQKLIATAQLLTTADVLPRHPIVALSPDGARLVYQTAAEGIRRWWLLEKGLKAKLLVEESD